MPLSLGRLPCLSCLCLSVLSACISLLMGFLLLSTVLLYTASAWTDVVQAWVLDSCHLIMDQRLVHLVQILNRGNMITSSYALSQGSWGEQLWPESGWVWIAIW